MYLDYTLIGFWILFFEVIENIIEVIREIQKVNFINYTFYKVD